MIRAAVAFHSEELGQAILIGRKEVIEHNMDQLGITPPEGLVIHNASLSNKNKEYIDFLYQKLQRQGFLYRDCQRRVHQDRNIFSACMVHFGEADGIVTGLTRSHTSVYDDLRLVFDQKKDHCTFGYTIGIGHDRTVFIADTSIHEFPDPETLACIAKQTAAKAKTMGHKPRVAFVSYSTFGNPMSEHSEHVREAVKILDQQKVSFEYDGDMSIEVALNTEAQKMYPFCRLSGPANILIMPGIHSASACSQLLQEVAGVNTLGPVLTGLEKSVQIAHLSNTVTDLINMAVLAAHDAIELKK
jgi:malate dehydrogenase (oxaloacetate-decarboxylating)(NADP+)